MMLFYYHCMAKTTNTSLCNLTAVMSSKWHHKNICNLLCCAHISILTKYRQISSAALVECGLMDFQSQDFGANT